MKRIFLRMRQDRSDDQTLDAGIGISGIGVRVTVDNRIELNDASF